MKELTKRCLSVLLALAVVGAGTVAFVNLDQGPEPVQQYGAVQEGDAAIATTTAIGVTIVAAGAGATAGAVMCPKTPICSGDTEAQKKAEKQETKVEISTRAATTVQQSELFLDSMENGLEGGAISMARSEAMTAYWDAVENDTSLAEAKSRARQANRDFWTVKFHQVANSWNLVAESYLQYDGVEENSSVSSDYVDMRRTGWMAGSDSSLSDQGLNGVTAPNQSQVRFRAIEGHMSNGGQVFHPELSPSDYSIRLRVGAGFSDFQTVHTPPVKRYSKVLEDIQNRSDQVDQAIDTVAEQTYQKALNGQLNASQFHSANTLAQQYAQEGNDQAWAAIRLSQMQGVGLPEDLDSIGTVRIESDGTTETGLFLSRTNPESGQFDRNTVYNATKLDGSQILVKEDGSYAEITGEFTILNITSPAGESRDSLTISNPDYSATDISEWRSYMENMSEWRAEINARQKKLLNGSSGGSSLFDDLSGFVPGLNGTQSLALLLLLLIAGAAVWTRTQSGSDITMVDTRRRD